MGLCRRAPGDLCALGQSCESPCTIVAKRDQSLQITISKASCATQTATKIRQLAGAGVLLGGLVDHGTGAVYDLQPNPLTITLACMGSWRTRPPLAARPSMPGRRSPCVDTGDGRL